MSAIEVMAVNTRMETEWLRAQQGAAFRAVDFEEDDLEMATGQSEPVTASTGVPEGMYFKVTVFTNDVREFYARKDNRQGTRIVYRSGAARPVKQSYDQVLAAFTTALQTGNVVSIVSQ